MGENVNLTLSSLTESSKEPVKIEKTPTNGTKRRKGKNPVEVSSTKGGVDGLKDVDDSIMRVRAAAKYVRSSPTIL
ncbi:hypothetical protein V6N13_125532 [Hibiscus sabdariffa]